MVSTESVHKSNSPTSTQSTEDEQGLPPQLHAGRVGYGPNYHPEPVRLFPVPSFETVDAKVLQTIEDKFTGLKEELKGKVKHDPELVKHGHSVRIGEEKQKKLTGEVQFSTLPFRYKNSHVGS
jgi:hypothetical protein